MPFQIVLPTALQQTILQKVLQGRQSGNEAVAQLVFSDASNGSELIGWVQGPRHSATVSTAVTSEYHYRGTFHTHPPETELEQFRGMGYPPSATDVNTLVGVKQNLLCIVASDDRRRSDPELYLLVKTKTSKGDHQRRAAAALRDHDGAVPAEIA